MMGPDAGTPGTKDMVLGWDRVFPLHLLRTGYSAVLYEYYTVFLHTTDVSLLFISMVGDSLVCWFPCPGRKGFPCPGLARLDSFTTVLYKYTKPLRRSTGNYPDGPACLRVYLHSTSPCKYEIFCLYLWSR